MTLSLPPYTYVPGHWPHPVRDPGGHSYGVKPLTSPPLDLRQWRECARYLEGMDLFNQGYYWEAHQAWEDIWKVMGRGGSEAQLLQGLIKVAASGIKIRQGYPKAARSLLTQSAGHFTRVMEKQDEPVVGGLRLVVLERWCRDFRDDVGDIKGHPELAVESLFPLLPLSEPDVSLA